MKTLFHHEHGGARAGKERTEGREVLDFSVNISPLFPSIGELSFDDMQPRHYPSIDGRGVRCFYADKFELNPASVLPLNGAIEGIYLVPRALCIRRLLLLSPSFYDYERAGRVAGAEISYIHLERENRFRLPGIEELAAALAEADAFFAANPNNPTGTKLPPEIVMALASRFPEKWFIVDEAFIQFTAAFPDNSLMGKVHALKNVIVIHSLTKFYALPGLRLGAVVAHPEIIRHLLDYKEPWTVNTVAESVALRLLQCNGFDRELRELIFRERTRVAAALSEIEGLHLYGGRANFFLAQWQRGVSLDELLEYLRSVGIHVRDCRNFAGLEVNYFRFAIMLPEENNRLLAAIRGAAGLNREK